MKFPLLARDNGLLLHDQVAAVIRQAISSGEAKTGERLPPAVDLAAILGVNKNTVIRALHILRDEGVLDFTRGRGARIVGTPDQSLMFNKIRELLQLGRHLGYRSHDLAQLITNIEKESQ
jgi:GntR family transcriptional regulator